MRQLMGFVPWATAIGLLLAITPATAAAQSETVEYYGLDALGSVRVIFGPQGQVIDRMDYGPFGENLRAAIKFPVEQFAQLARDAESGQDYAQARNYSPGTGRLNRVDPVYAGLFDPQQWNRYGYGRNNPVRFGDPSGSVIISPLCEGPCFDPGEAEVFAQTRADSFYLRQRGNRRQPGRPQGPGGIGQPGPTPGPAHPAEPEAPVPAPESDDGCPTAPPRVSIRSNVNRATTIGLVLDSGPLAAANQLIKYAGVYFTFRNGGPMDYKQTQQGDDFGNFNYGAVNAALNVPEQIALRAAGWAQQRARTSLAEWGHPSGSSPYGDDPDDQSMISLGYAYYSNPGVCK
jgi:RHS repeat-associated protein